MKPPSFEVNFWHWQFKLKFRTYEANNYRLVQELGRMIQVLFEETDGVELNDLTYVSVDGEED